MWLPAYNAFPPPVSELDFVPWRGTPRGGSAPGSEPWPVRNDMRRCIPDDDRPRGIWLPSLQLGRPSPFSHIHPSTTHSTLSSRPTDRRRIPPVVWAGGEISGQESFGPRAAIHILGGRVVPRGKLRPAMARNESLAGRRQRWRVDPAPLHGKAAPRMEVAARRWRQRIWKVACQNVAVAPAGCARNRYHVEQGTRVWMAR